jgi:amidohydrolase
MPETDHPTSTPTLIQHGDSELRDRVIGWRRRLHANPELSFEEHETSAFIAETLKALGVDVSRPTPTSVIGRLNAGQRPAVALRADIDALPITEETNLPYASSLEGRMHACGHDGHTAILLGVAAILAGKRDELAGEIRFIFQHAEEKPPGGANELISLGAVEGVDYVFGLHLWAGLPVGKVAVPVGPCMAAADMFSIEIEGSGGHAALPQDCIDPIAIGAQVITNLQHLVSRTIDPLQAAVVSATQFHGGSADNVIPNHAVIRGTIRAFDPDVRAVLETAIDRTAQGVVEAHGASYRFHLDRGYGPVVNDPAAAALVARAVEETLGADALIEMAPIMGGDDFSAYQLQVPGCYFFVGVRNDALQAVYPHHHPRFAIDEDALEIGCKVLGQAAVLGLTEPPSTDAMRLCP